MKRIFLISVVCVSFYSLQAQMEIITNGNVGVNETSPQRQLHITDNYETQLQLQNTVYDAPTGNKGAAGIKFLNSNSYNWEIMNASTNHWSHQDALAFFNRSNGGHLSLVLMPNNWLHFNGPTQIGYYGHLLTTNTGIDGQSNGFDFNPGNSNEGFLISQKRAESSGIYFDGDFCTIFSPGDQNRLLRVYDEDGMQEKWFIDGTGTAYTNSDSTRKENIKELKEATKELKKLKAKSYTFKIDPNEEESVLKVNGFPDGMVGQDSSLVAVKSAPTNKSKETRECYGFLAQDVEKVFPNLVLTNEEGDKFVSYSEFIPLLVDGYNQQEEELTILKSKIEELEKLVVKLSQGIK